MNYPAPQGSRSRKSRIFNSRRLFVSFATFAVLALVATSAFWNSDVVVRTAKAAGSLTGAIYTSNIDGTIVNANHYDAKEDVYLNGGPQGGGSGLPNGDYYYQVTNPNGDVLLSSDKAECRQLTVIGNVIMGPIGPACQHVPGTMTGNGSIPVQLFPFDTTPNGGGVYKVWLIPQDDAGLDPNDPDGKHLIFTHSKTDNFKIKEGVVTPQTVIGGVKYYDTNNNGVLDTDEEGIEGVEIDVTTDTGTTQLHTDSSGSWSTSFPQGTTFKACEVLPNNTYTQTAPTENDQTTDHNATADAARCWKGTVGAADTSDLNFGNIICQPVITCPTNITGVVADANCQASVEFATPTASDNCDGHVTVSCDHLSGSAFQLGTTKVTCTATDDTNRNNTASCSFNVTVEDKTGPVLSLPTGVTQCAAGGGSCSAVVTYNATANDNCDGPVTVSCDHPSGSTFGLGTTLVTCSAQDSHGNKSQGSFNVTVNDCSVGSISGTKFYDGDTNPVNDSLGIGSWKIVLSGSASGTQYTNGSGYYSFGSLGPGTYTVTEYAPNLSWTLEPPSSQTFTISCGNVSNAFKANFHNYCKSPSGGLTLGFWSNKNGQALETAADFTALNALHLRKANGTDQDFTGTLAQNKTALNSWILSANATNMAYMLSAQLTAMKLNVLHGNVNGNSFALCFGGTINDLMAATEASLTANPNTTAAGPARTYQESLKTCLDNLNNNALVIPPTPCSFGSPY